MAKPPLSMKPTGWFQVAWSDEIGVGDVHRMKYFDQEMVAWRARVRSADRDERLLRAPRRAPRVTAATSRARCIAVPVPRVAVEPAGPQRLHPVPGPAQPRPPHPHLSGGRAQRVGLHLARHRGPRAVLRRAGRVRRASATAAAPPTTTRSSGCTGRALELHPQYVLENGVDFAHFKYVHKTPIVPVFTRHDFDEPVSLRRLHHHLRGRRRPEDRGRQQRRRGDQRRPRHRGDQELGHGRQPHHLGDHARRRVAPPTCGSWSTSAATPGKDPARAAAKAAEFGAGSDPAVRAGHPHLAAPALFRPARAGERRVRGLHRNSQVGQAVLSRRHRRQRRRAVRRTRKAEPDDARKPIRVFQVATGNVGSEMIKRIAAQPDLELVGVHCYSPEKVGKRRRRAGGHRRPTA